jgi:hypothetical protein
MTKGLYQPFILAVPFEGQDDPAGGLIASPALGRRLPIRGEQSRLCEVALHHLPTPNPGARVQKPLQLIFSTTTAVTHF